MLIEYVYFLWREAIGADALERASLEGGRETQFSTNRVILKKQTLLKMAVTYD